MQMDTTDTKTINLRDLPEDLVRRAKACAALHGMTLRDFVMRAVAKATEDDLPAFTTSTMSFAATVVSEKKQRKRAK
jgi:hypothetical protein